MRLLLLLMIACGGSPDTCETDGGVAAAGAPCCHEGLTVVQGLGDRLICRDGLWR